VIGICERFKCLPSALFAEPEDLPGGGLLRLLMIEKMGTPEGGHGGQMGGGDDW